MFGCSNREHGGGFIKNDNIDKDVKVSVLEYDGCEYIIMTAYSKGGISHKGNCKNPIHQE